MAKWEYKIETLVGTLLSDDVSSIKGRLGDVSSLESKLNELGEQGWELINMVAQPAHITSLGQGGGVDYNHLFFKREK